MNIKKLTTFLLVILLISINIINVKADDAFYGIVCFDGEVKYTSIYNGETSFDSSFGKDGAFLYKENGKVYFKISGDIGYIDEDEVEVISLDETKDNISAYFVRDNILYHNIKTNLNNRYYTYCLPLDEAPDFLQNDTKYYSYDGKYFYISFEDMIDDYLENDNQKAVNHEEPYYNYYEFLPARSYTNITLDDLNNYMYDHLKIIGKLNSYSDLSKDGANDVVNRSQIYEELPSFLAYESIFGVNAIRLFSEAINESSFGKSYDSYVSNNLYSSFAFDNDKERELNRYLNIDESIYAHAKYFISRAYCNNYYDFYKGSALGNKASGVSFSYSKDLYNGEKVASNYYLIDAYFNFKDKNGYTIGIIENLDYLSVYKNEELDEKLYDLKNIKDFSTILLEELDDTYKIQIDPSLSKDYMYDPELCIGYIDKDKIDYIVGSSVIEENRYKNVNFDFGDGQLHGFNDLTIKIQEDKKPVMVYPVLNGYEATGFNEDGDNNFDTHYEEIHRVEIKTKAKEKNEYGEPLNLKNGLLKVTYGNFKSKTIAYNSNIVKGMDEGKLHLEYNGFDLVQSANISYGLIDSKDEIDEIVNRNIESYKNDGSYNIDELKRVKEDIKELGYELSFDEIRILDEIFLIDSRNDVNYSFEKFDHDISVSGLALAMREPGILKIFKPFKDTYFTRIGTTSNQHQTICDKVAFAYGFEEVTSLKLSIQFNLRTADLESPIVASIKIDDKKDNSIYTVYHVDENGDVIKCLTSQSDDYIQFLCKENGDYFVYRKDGFNDFDFDNYYENINFYNADADNHLLFINGSILFVIGLVGAAIIVMHIKLNEKQEKIWRDYKKYWQPVVSPQEEKPKN